MRDEIDALGIRFASVDGDDSWHVDPIPRVIAAADWEPVAAGLAQRVRALNAFVADVYAERRIVAAGVVPQRVLDTADHSSPRWPASARAAASGSGSPGLDVVRDGDGTWLVLEDNVRTPSGFALLDGGPRGDAQRARAPGRGAAAADRRAGRARCGACSAPAAPSC